MSDPSIEEAIARVKSGDIDAYALVVASFQRRLRALLAAACPPGLDPDEIAHRALVFAYQRIDDYEPNTEFFAWLSAITRNLLRAEFERLRRLARHQDNYYRHVLVQDLNIMVAHEPVVDETRVAALRDCRAQLPGRTQALLEWYYGEQSSVSSIANRMGKTVAAVKSQLFAARKRLRECMGRKLRSSSIQSFTASGYESI